MAWYYWLWIIIAIPFFLWGYNGLVEKAQIDGMYWGKPTRVGHLAIIYVLDPAIAFLFAVLWPFLVVALGSVTIVSTLKIYRAGKKAVSSD